jgi:hypothetical protein
MRNSVLRPLLVLEFLIAIEAIFTLWIQVGGQYHLDLMYWPWKFGLSVGAAGLIVALTACIALDDGAIGRRSWLFFSLLIGVVLLAGVVTYYYHLHEPADEDDQDEPARVAAAVRLTG